MHEYDGGLLSRMLGAGSDAAALGEVASSQEAATAEELMAAMHGYVDGATADHFMRDSGALPPSAGHDAPSLPPQSLPAQESMAGAMADPMAVADALHARLMAAAQAGQLDELRGLLEGGASVYTRDANGASALHAAAAGGQLHVAQALLAAGARADARDNDGAVPADVAASGELRELLAAALDEQYEEWSEKSYDSAQDDRPWH